ncbi:MAG: HAD family phosphatase [Candidatus Moranbacteria bacterium]|nr:HAD family phosphatase [Candidatus Moranbacteria bacterium]
MKKVAVFDIDGTIFRSSLLIEIVEASIDSGIFKPSIRRHYTSHYKNWLDRKDYYGKYIGGVVRAFESNIKGVSHKDIVRIARKIISAKKDRTYQYTRDLVKELQKKNYYLVAISNSPQVLVDDFSKEFGFDKSYGRIYEVDKKGLFTGRTMHEEIISDKAKVLQRVVEKEKLTIKNSVAVGDTEADIPMLKIVSDPICFNPNRALYAVARKNGWKVVVERKDMVYEIK